MTRNLPDMVRAASKLSQKHPDVRFAVACLHERHKKLAEEIIAQTIARESTSPGPTIEVYSERTPELIRLARVAWAVSGSVGLELMVEGLPSVVLYKVNRFDLWVARHFIKSRYISLVNLLADDEVFPEYLTWRDVSDEMVRWAVTWLDDPETRERTVDSIVNVRQRVAQPGASTRAATHIAHWLFDHRQKAAAAPASSSVATLRGPHELGSQPSESSDAKPERR